MRLLWDIDKVGPSAKVKRLPTGGRSSMEIRGMLKKLADVDAAQVG